MVRSVKRDKYRPAGKPGITITITITLKFGTKVYRMDI
jgi:hypothetical protein